MTRIDFNNAVRMGAGTAHPLGKRGERVDFLVPETDSGSWLGRRCGTVVDLSTRGRVLVAVDGGEFIARLPLACCGALPAKVAGSG